MTLGGEGGAINIHYKAIYRSVKRLINPGGPLINYYAWWQKKGKQTRRRAASSSRLFSVVFAGRNC